MPELPEVETIRSDLNKKILNKRIVSVEVRKAKMVKGKAKDFTKFVKGKMFDKIERRGKLLMFSFASVQEYLLVHLKMTGQLIYQKGNKTIAGGHSDTLEKIDITDKHTHIIITFSNKGALYFNDIRQFGYMHIVDDEGLTKAKNKFGIEPLTPSYTKENFLELFKNKKAPLKTVLLNQKLVAGIGNIYADEICFAAGIRPSRRVNKLTISEKEKLWQVSQKIIKKAIEKRGTTFNNYVDAEGQTGNFVKYLEVYGRSGEKCRKCEAVLQKTRVAGRGTVYCPQCQK